MLVCGLLGKLLYEYPDRTWLQPLVEQDVFADFPLDATEPDAAEGLRLLRGWCVQRNGAIEDAALDDLRVDCTRLFMGPGIVPAAPWESVYFNEERMLFQQQTVQVRAWYRRFGLERASRENEPEDHIGLELAFAAHLTERALRALEGGTSAEAEELLEARRAFLNEHLLRWAPAWCAAVQKHARTDFYRGAAHLTQGTLAQIRARQERAS